MMFRAKRGNYTAIAAIGLPVVLGFVAFAIDMSRIQMAQVELENAADSVAHAALVSLRDGDSVTAMRAKARKLARKNSILGDDVSIRAGREVKIGFWDFDNKTWTQSSTTFNSVQVTLARDQTSRDDPIQLLISPFMGFDYVNLTADNSAIAAMQTRDTMLVVDTTTSFINEMPNARQAALTLLNTMRDRYITGDRVGMALFVGDGKVFTTLRDSYNEYGAIYDDWSGAGYGPPSGMSVGCVPSASSLGAYDCTDYQMQGTVRYYWSWGGYYAVYDVEFKNVTFPVQRGLTYCDMRNDTSGPGQDVYLNSWYWYGDSATHLAPEMLNCGAGGGGTNQGAGIEVAMDELLANGTVASVKSVVLISDGAPVDPLSGYWLSHFGGPNMGSMSSAEYGTAMSNEVDSHNFHTFSVSFNDTTSAWAAAQQSAYLESLTTGAGGFYETPDSTELPSILQRIAENIPLVIVQ